MFVVDLNMKILVHMYVKKKALVKYKFKAAEQA